jgi:response regulator NasT
MSRMFHRMRKRIRMTSKAPFSSEAPPSIDGERPGPDRENDPLRSSLPLPAEASGWPEHQVAAFKPALRILAAAHDPENLHFYERVLPGMGHQVCIARTGKQLIDLSRILQPEPQLVITDGRFQELQGVPVIEEICRIRSVPIICVTDSSASHSPPLLDFSHIQALLFPPLKAVDLKLAIEAAVRRFEQLQSLQQEIAYLRQALEDRKIVERAKGMVMKYAGLNEEDAFHRMQKMASFQNKKLIQVGIAILNAGTLFQQIERQPQN